MKQMEEKAAMPIQPMSFVAFFITDKKKEGTMGKRTRDEVIYSRVDYRVKQEFESQMKGSGAQQITQPTQNQIMRMS